MKKIAVILFNLGGPDNLDAVQPFLFNLFHDPAIINLPQPLRYLIAKLIAKRRAPFARAIYDRINGSSPILKNTRAQAKALEQILNQSGKTAYKVFIAMRYWHPFTEEAACAVKAYRPDTIILLPLYPQFSTTTTASSFKEWHQRAKKIGLSAVTQKICCYPQHQGFIRALAHVIRGGYDEARAYGTPRLLFSAHGLPEKIIKAGDPYAAHCALTVEALRQELNIEILDSVLCFQSRVGPMKWIGPSTDDEVRRAGRDKVPLVIAPIAFVSDHSETLVEIDMEYRHLAGQSGVPHFVCVPPVGIAPDFIGGLAALIAASQASDAACVSGNGASICPPSFAGCPCRIVSHM